MTFGRPTTLEEVLDAVALRAATALGLSTDYVFPALDLGDLEKDGGPADTFAVLTGPSFRADRRDVDGGGNQMLTMDGSVTLELWNRVEADLSYQDVAALKVAALGILGKFRPLLRNGAGLQMFTPARADDTARCLLKEPMRLIGFDLRPRGRTGWTRLVSRWEIAFVQDQTG